MVHSVSNQLTVTSMVLVLISTAGLLRKPSPFLLQTVVRFEKYLGVYW